MKLNIVHIQTECRKIDGLTDCDHFEPVEWFVCYIDTHSVWIINYIHVCRDMIKSVNSSLVKVLK